MDTKTCKKCGWVVSIHEPSLRCPICGTQYEVRECRICGAVYTQWEKHHFRPVCSKCYYRVIKQFDKQKKLLDQRRRDVYNEWLEKIKLVPDKYPRLTEEQWMEAVKHFGKCALCGDESIDARGYFVPFKLGGKYCDWNIIPICSKCALKTRQNYNYFITDRPPGLVDIITYLEVRLEKAINWTDGESDG